LQNFGKIIVPDSNRTMTSSSKWQVVFWKCPGISIKYLNGFWFSHFPTTKEKDWKRHKIKHAWVQLCMIWSSVTIYKSKEQVSVELSLLTSQFVIFSNQSQKLDHFMEKENVLKMWVFNMLKKWILCVTVKALKH